MSNYGTLIDKNTVHFERLLTGPIERVWQYLTEPELRGKWFAAGEMEPRVGGALDLTFNQSRLVGNDGPPPERFKKYTGIHKSQHIVTRFDPPHLLAFTWSNGIDGEPSEVEITLTQRGDKVLLELTHRRLGNREAAVNVSGGWHVHLGLLAELLADQKPTPFWQAFDGLEEHYEKQIPKA
ncbi:MAG TPA: SRPBCC family protein [Parvibaculum sp.]|jgi:uncharacterized protein YndB with AHSA1/START domain